MMTYHFYIALIFLLLIRSYFSHNYMRKLSDLGMLSVKEHFLESDNRLVYFMFNIGFRLKKSENKLTERLRLVSNIIAFLCWLIIVATLIEVIIDLT